MAERKTLPPQARAYAPREVVDLLTLGFATRYMRRLIADRDHIRSAILNPGGSVILTGVTRYLEGTDEYSSQLGNDYHLDLLQAEIEITNNCPHKEHQEQPFTDKQRAVLFDWAANVSEQEAKLSGLTTQTSGALRRNKHYSVAKVTKRMTNG